MTQETEDLLEAAKIFILSSIHSSIEAQEMHFCLLSTLLTWASRGGSKGEQMLPLGFGHLVKHLVKILTFFVIILTFGQNTSICSPLKKFASPTKIPADAHDY